MAFENLRKRIGGAIARTALRLSGARGYAFAKESRWKKLLKSLSKKQSGAALWNAEASVIADYARALDRNMPEARRAAEYLADTILSVDGFWPRFRTDNEALNTALKDRWDDWTDIVDTRGEESWTDVLRTLVCEFVISGEGLAGWYVGKSGLVIDTFEGQQLSSMGVPAPGNTIAGGVEYDALGRRVAYHLIRSTPGGAGIAALVSTPVAIPAAQVINLWRKRRPSDFRGTSMFAPVGEDMNHLMEANRTEMIMLRVLSVLGIHFKTQPDADPNTSGDDMGAEVGAEERASRSDEDRDAVELRPGMIHYGDEDPTVIDSNRPSGEYQSFRKSLLKAIAAALGIPYSALSGDCAEAKYASARVEEMHCRKGYRVLQGLIVRKVCRPILLAWIRTEVSSGRIKLPNGMEPADVLRNVTWQIPGWEWVDPQADGEALKTELAIGKTTWSQAMEEDGKDPEEQAAAIARDQKLKAKFGIKIPIAGEFSDKPTAGRPPNDPAAEDPAQVAA